MNHLIKRNHVHDVIVHSAICLAITGVFYFLQRVMPVAYLYLIVEDSWGEFATFNFFFFASLLLVWAMKLDRTTFLKPGYILLSLGFFLIAMEEISWGQRLFGIKTPYVISKMNYQSEINVHNVIDEHINLRMMLCYIIWLWLFIFPVVTARFKNLKKLAEDLGIPQIPIYQYPYFILVTAAFCFINLIFHHYELVEIVLGTAFLLLAGHCFFKAREKKREGLKISRRIFFSCITVVIVGVTAVLVSVGSDINRVAGGFHDTASKDFPKIGLYAQSEYLFEYILENKHLQRPDTLLKYGLFLKEIKSDKADAILQEALKKEYEFMKQRPDKAKPSRLAGKILKLLNRDAEAQNEFQQALKKDQIYLESAKEDWAKLHGLISLAETYFEMGDKRSAVNHFEEAYKFAVRREDQVNLRKLIKGLKNNSPEPVLY